MVQMYEKNIRISLLVCSVIYMLIVYSIFNESLLFDKLKYSLEGVANPFPIYNYLTGNGKFDDFLGGYSRNLPNSNDSFIISPLVIYFIQITSQIPRLAHSIFLVLSVALWLNALWLLFRNKTLVLLFVLQYPVWFAFFRSNSEFLAAGFVFNFLVYSRGADQRSSFFSVVMLVLAVTVKPTAILFSLLANMKTLLRYWYVFLVAVLLNILCVVNSDLSVLNYFHEYVGALMKYRSDYVVGGGGTMFNNSFYGLYKLICIAKSDYLSLGKPIESIKIAAALSYSILWQGLSIIFCLSVFFVRSFYLKLGLLVAVTTFLPHIAADYRLLYVLIYSAFLLVKKPDSNKFNNICYNVLYLLSVLIILPKHFLYVTIYSRYGESFTSQILINPVLGAVFLFALCLLLVCTVSKFSSK